MLKRKLRRILSSLTLICVVASTMILDVGAMNAPAVDQDTIYISADNYYDVDWDMLDNCTQNVVVMIPNSGIPEYILNSPVTYGTSAPSSELECADLSDGHIEYINGSITSSGGYPYLYSELCFTGCMKYYSQLTNRRSDIALTGIIDGDFTQSFSVSPDHTGFFIFKAPYRSAVFWYRFDCECDVEGLVRNYDRG